MIGYPACLMHGHVTVTPALVVQRMALSGEVGHVNSEDAGPAQDLSRPLGAAAGAPRCIKILGRLLC